MLVAKLLSDQIDINVDIDESGQDDFREDPNIPEEFYRWAKKKKISKFLQLITRKGIFTPREISRKVHLIYVLNIMSSILVGFYNRNEKTMENLNDYAEIFDEKDRVVALLEATADVILKLKLKPKSYLLNKANIFSLIISVALSIQAGNDISIEILSRELAHFESEIPEDYKLAAAEAVNSTRARQLRNSYLSAIIQQATTV
ncbi:UNVERIFIED_CONTAM: hypothetical protein MT382_07185 [Aeromonas salmonicida]